MKKIILCLLLFGHYATFAQTPCTSGFAGNYPCQNIDLFSNLALTQLGGTTSTRGNDCWGWTDPLNGKEYALMGCTSHTAFVDITNPAAPVYLGKLNSTNNINSSWRDIKVYNNYAFIVSEASGHGMQVFDLTKLRNVTTPQIFTVDALYTGFGNCHNIAINESTGFAYCIGTSTFSGGIHAVNIQNPVNPVFSFGYAAQGYCHDAQIIIYNGPDTEHTGKEIFFGANETKVVIMDITNKSNPIVLSTFNYSNTSYTHQGWLTSDQKYWMLGDELDEQNFGFTTRTVVVDLTNLDLPVLKTNYLGATAAIDHNGYTLNNEFYLANYRAGVRIINTSNLNTASTLNEIAFFDTYPASNSAQFNGAWSVYPYFPSGNFIVSDIERGLFVLRKNAALGIPNSEKFEVTAFPNPVKDILNVTSNEEIKSIEIYNILGKQVDFIQNINAMQFSLNVLNYSQGLYLMNINNTKTIKFIVE